MVIPDYTIGEFNDKIHAEFTPPNTWVLEKSLSFKTKRLSEFDCDVLIEVGANIDKRGRITCDAGMKTDLASVPRIAWAVIAPWDVARAAVIHDHLYSTLRKYYYSKLMNKSKWKKARALSDKVFLLGMKSSDPRVSKFKMYSAYWAVRMFGRWPASANEEV